MRKVGKVLVWIVVLLVVVALGVVATRAVNQARHPEPDLEYPHPADPASYPTSVPGVTVTPIADGPIRGFHLRPDEIRHRGVVMVWGGSEGGPDFRRAELLAREGHEVLSLFYFGQPDQPATLNRVPVESAMRALDWAEANEVATDPVTLVGTSKGAELAALLPAYEPRVTNVALYAPVDHVTQGLDQRDVASSWTHAGEELPYVAFSDGRDFGAAMGLMGASVFGYPLHLRPAYEAALAAPASADKRIDLTRVPGEVLIFAGGDDQLWPSDAAARRFAEERPERTEVHVYDGAGHVFDVPGDYAEGMRMGGSAEANAVAKADSDRILVERLAAWHR